MSEFMTVGGIDKSGWGPGPWQDEPDRKEWTHAGFDCLIVRVASHGRCVATSGCRRVTRGTGRGTTTSRPTATAG